MSGKKLLALTNRLEQMGAFDSKPNKVADKMARMLGEEVPYSMSIAIANYTMATFTGHFHYKLDLGENNLVPMNVIIFVLAKSGAKKTSSMLKLEASIKLGYEAIDSYRQEKARMTMEEQELDFMPYIPPLSNSLATLEGMVQRLNDFSKEGIGLPALYVDEISTELASNADMIPNMKLVAQLFDVGEFKSKPLKDRKNQSEEVTGMGMTALFIGSEHGILEDKALLSKFMVEFISKYARRGIIVYPNFPFVEDDEDDVDKMVLELRSKKGSSVSMSKELNLLSKQVASTAINNDYNLVKLSDECQTLYDIYMLYCEAKVQEGNEAVILEQQHRHWKALKLAGVYSVWNRHTVVEASDLQEAIYVVEAVGSDLSIFIDKASRLPYEILLAHYVDGGEDLTPHDMVKKGLIGKLNDVKGILELANSKSGASGMLEFDHERGAVTYTSFRKQDGFGFSYKHTESLEQLILQGVGRKEAKGRLASKTATDFKYYQVDKWTDAIKVMRNDTAYIPFELRGGIRGKDYILGGCNFLVLDVDDTDVPWTECFDMLSDYNCAIALGSDEHNPFKYRVLLPTDVEIEIDNNKWKPFMKKVSEHLGIPIDLLPMSQFYFGYKGRKILVNEDGENIEASDLVKNIDVKPVKVKQLKRHQIDDAWDERMYTFSNAYNATADKGLHNNLWYATVKAHDMGFTLEQGLALLDDIVDYIDDEPRPNYVSTLKKRMIEVEREYKNWVEEVRNAGLAQ